LEKREYLRCSNPASSDKNAQKNRVKNAEKPAVFSAKKRENRVKSYKTVYWTAMLGYIIFWGFPGGKVAFKNRIVTP
jgi:hypothetical protein